MFAQKGLRTQIERVPYPTGTVQVTLDAMGVPCYEIKEGVAWDNIPFTDELKRLALNTRAVCFGSLAQRNEVSRITINRFLDLQDKCWILLAKYNLKMLILTCGTNGSYVFTPGVVSFQETPRVPVADTVGAGDSFTAAFTSAVLSGKPVQEAHKLAVEVSAYVCTQSGAMPELPQVLKDRI